MTETAQYEPRVKAYEPSPFLLATSRAQEALGVAKHFQLHEDVREAIAFLHACLEAEPESTLLASDFRYLAARAERTQDLVRKHFHPSNPAVLGHLAQAREHLAIASLTA